MDRPCVAENGVQRARLQAVVDRLTDVDTARPVGENRTAGVGIWMFLPSDGSFINKATGSPPRKGLSRQDVWLACARIMGAPSDIWRP